MKNINGNTIPNSPPLEGLGEVFNSSPLGRSGGAVAIQNACKLCSPLGASVAYKGFEGCVPLIHGSQGCATYIRRYLISHYKEPIDIASSNFTQDSTIFGGDRNFKLAAQNIINQYKPKIIGISTTCLSETIGDDVTLFLHELKSEDFDGKTEFVVASTPSYQGTHIDGFHEAVAAVVRKFAKKETPGEHINLFPGFISTEDIRLLKEIVADFGIEAAILPDYSESLDNPVWQTYKRIPEGGTTLEEVKKSGSALASIEFGTVLNLGKLSGRVKNLNVTKTAAQYLEKQMDVPLVRLPMPIGITQTDRFFEELEKLSGKQTPEKYTKQRGRLVDAYVDAHKYVFGKKAVVYGEEDFVVGMCAFLDEIGIEIALAASGGESGLLEQEILKYCPENNTKTDVREGYDFESIKEWCESNKPDILVGHSKGYYIARELEIPIVRVGFPIHDRIGGQRIKHLGYAGTQELFDKIVNALIEYKQDASPVGYKYM
ncbi:MAG: nitrogenase component 1 [Draconibacterium sp.]